MVTAHPYRAVRDGWSELRGAERDRASRRQATVDDLNAKTTKRRQALSVMKALEGDRLDARAGVEIRGTAKLERIRRSGVVTSGGQVSFPTRYAMDHGRGKIDSIGPLSFVVALKLQPLLALDRGPPNFPQVMAKDRLLGDIPSPLE